MRNSQFPSCQCPSDALLHSTVKLETQILGVIFRSSLTKIPLVVSMARWWLVWEDFVLPCCHWTMEEKSIPCTITWKEACFQHSWVDCTWDYIWTEIVRIKLWQREASISSFSTSPFLILCDWRGWYWNESSTNIISSLLECFIKLL